MKTKSNTPVNDEPETICSWCGEDLDCFGMCDCDGAKADRSPDPTCRNYVTTYGNWRIEFAPPPIPTHQFDYSFWHADFAGDGDNRCGHAESVIDAMTQIDELEDEAFVCGCTAPCPSECMALDCGKRDDRNARHAAYHAEADKFAVLA